MATIRERLRNLRPFVAVLAGVSIGVALIDVGLSALSATPVLGWIPKTVTGTGFLDDSRQRVVAAEQEYRDGRVDASLRLAAIVGISNVRQSIDLPAVAGGFGSGWRVLGLAGAGMGMADVAKYGDLLLTSYLQPELVLLGIDPHQLVDPRPRPPSMHVSAGEYLRRGDLRNVAIALRASVWAYSRRQDLSTAANTAALDVRERVFRVFGVRAADLLKDVRSPWRELIKSDWPDHFSAATLREEEAFFEAIGAFDPSAYRPGAEAAVALVRLITGFRSRGARVVLLLMPQHSTLNRRTPQAATTILQGTVEAAFPGSSVPIWDYREAVADDGFVDLAHLNGRGSATFSAILASRIRSDLAGASAR